MSTSSWNVWKHRSDEDLVRLANAGERDATEVLIRRYRPVVERKARMFYGAGLERDDLVQEGLLGLLGAISQYRADKLDQFRPFAELVALRRMMTALRLSTGARMAVLNGATSLHGWTESATGMPVPGADVASAWAFEHVLEQAQLTDLESQVLLGIWKGFTYRELGTRLGCHRKRVDNAYQRAKRKISSTWRTQIENF